MSINYSMENYQCLKDLLREWKQASNSAIYALSNAESRGIKNTHNDKAYIEKSARARAFKQAIVCVINEYLSRQLPDKTVKAYSDYDDEMDEFFSHYSTTAEIVLPEAEEIVIPDKFNAIFGGVDRVLKEVVTTEQLEAELERRRAADGV